jgi:hypothetical protein
MVYPSIANLPRLVVIRHRYPANLKNGVLGTKLGAQRPEAFWSRTEDGGIRMYANGNPAAYEHPDLDQGWLRTATAIEVETHSGPAIVYLTRTSSVLFTDTWLETYGWSRDPVAAELSYRADIAATSAGPAIAEDRAPKTVTIPALNDTAMELYASYIQGTVVTAFKKSFEIPESFYQVLTTGAVLVDADKDIAPLWRELDRKISSANTKVPELVLTREQRIHITVWLTTHYLDLESQALAVNHASDHTRTLLRKLRAGSTVPWWQTLFFWYAQARFSILQAPRSTMHHY